MDKYYYHPDFGYHQGVPIGGDESTEISEEEYLLGIEQTASQEIDDTDIYILAKKKLDLIQKEKCRVRDSGVAVPVDGTSILFDTDESARIAYLEFLGLSQLSPGHVETNWKASANIFVAMTQELFFQVIVARQTNERNAFEWQKARVQEIEEAVANNDKIALIEVSEIYQ